MLNQWFSEEFIFSLALLMLVLVRDFSHTPDSIFSEKFLIQSSRCFSLVRRFFFFSITHLIWCLVRSFSYIPDASFSESTLFMPVLVWGFSGTPDASQNLMSFTYTLRVQWF